MPLPEWAVSPGPTFEHDDNYSDLEVVWTATDTKETLVQTRLGYIGPFGEDVPVHGSTHVDLLGEVRTDALDAAQTAEAAHARLEELTELHIAVARQIVRQGNRLDFLTRRLVPLAAVVGACGGVVGVHFLPWHV